MRLPFLFLSWQNVIFCFILFSFNHPINVLAFTFNNTAPSQCDDFTVTWTGGQAPFRLLIIPPGRPITNQTIPASAFNNNVGSYTTQLLLPQYQRVLFTISDALGVASGGITDLLTVGQSLSGKECNTTSPSPQFFFSLDTDLVECKPYPFSLYPNAIQPITIYGFIPLGQSFTLYPPIGDSFAWKNNLTAGTSVTFSMQDSQGRDGGTSGIGVVKLSDNKSCISSTGDVGSSPSASPTAKPSTKSTSNIALIAGAAAGGAVVLLALVCLTVCLLRRRQRKARRMPVMRMGKSKETVDLLGGDTGNTEGESGQLLPYVVTPFASEFPVGPMSRKEQIMQSISNESPTSTPIFSEFGDSGYLQAGGSSRYSNSQMGSSRGTRASMHSQDGLPAPQIAGDRSSYAPSAQRVIVHTDIAETMEDDQLLELPPLYSERRSPIPGLLSSNTPTSTAASSADTTSPPRAGKRRS